MGALTELCARQPPSQPIPASLHRFSPGDAPKPSKGTRKICSVWWKESKRLCWKFLKRFCPNLLEQRRGSQNTKLAFQRRSKQHEQQRQTWTEVCAWARGRQRASLQPPTKAPADLSTRYTCGLKGQETCLKGTHKRSAFGRAVFHAHAAFYEIHCCH